MRHRMSVEQPAPDLIPFCEVLDNQKVLNCTICERVRVHRPLGPQTVEHTFVGYGGNMMDGTGVKDLWECRVCGAQRIYGAPQD